MVMELKILQSNRSNLFKVLIGQEKKNKLPPKLIVYNQGVIVGSRAFTGFLALPLLRNHCRQIFRTFCCCVHRCYSLYFRCPVPIIANKRDYCKVCGLTSWYC